MTTITDLQAEADQIAAEHPDILPIEPPSPDDKRASYTAGLRALADLLDRHPDVPIPMAGTGKWNPISFAVGFGGEDDEAVKAGVVQVARTLINGHWRKEYDAPNPDSYGDGCLRIYGTTAAGLTVHIYTPREKVCRKVVTTAEVTKTVPDPTVEVPQVEITETVETVEWVCEPLLAASA